KQGLTPQAMRDITRSNLLQKAIATKVTAKLAVSDAEIRAYYQRNRAQYKSRPSRSMRAIYVKTEARAEALAALLRHGADFATLARRSSLDPAAKKTGGKLVYQQGMLASADDAMARALPDGRVSKPVRFGTSWALLLPLGPVQPPHQVPLDHVRLPILQYLLGQKRQRKLSAWMDGVKQSCATNARFAKGYELTR